MEYKERDAITIPWFFLLSLVYGWFYLCSNMQRTTIKPAIGICIQSFHSQSLQCQRPIWQMQSGKCSHYLGIKAQSPQCNSLQTIGNQMNKKYYLSPITNSQHTVREELATRILTRYMQDKQTQSGCTAMMLHSQ